MGEFAGHRRPISPDASLRHRWPTLQYADMAGSAAHLQFFRMASELALFPRASRRPRATVLCLKSKFPPWKWAA